MDKKKLQNGSQTCTHAVSGCSSSGFNFRLELIANLRSLCPVSMGFWLVNAAAFTVRVYLKTCPYECDYRELMLQGFSWILLRESKFGD